MGKRVACVRKSAKGKFWIALQTASVGVKVQTVSPKA